MLNAVCAVRVWFRVVPREPRAEETDVYRELGVRPFINAAGTYTALSASLMAPQVLRAMEQASRRHVSIPELQEAAGKRIASLVGCEAALVTSGCAQAPPPTNTALKTATIVTPRKYPRSDWSVRSVTV